MSPPKPRGRGNELDEYHEQLNRSLRKFLWAGAGISVGLTALTMIAEYFLLKSAIKNGVAGALAQSPQNRVGY